MLKLIKLLILQFKYHRAMNILAKQEWSVDFLVYILRKANTQGLAIRIKDTNGRVLEIINTTEVERDYYHKEQQIMQNDIDIALGLKELGI